MRRSPPHQLDPAVKGHQQAPNTAALYFNKTQLARKARRIHDDAPAVRFYYTFGSPNTLIVNVNADRTVCSGGPCDSYEWDWGDGSPTGSGVTASHEYAAGGTYAIKLTVEEWGEGGRR